MTIGKCRDQSLVSSVQFVRVIPVWGGGFQPPPPVQNRVKRCPKAQKQAWEYPKNN